MTRGYQDILIQDPVEWAHPLNQGLVSWWLALPSLPRGNRWHDLTRRNPGTLTNGPTWQGARGRPGGWGSLNLNGSTQYVETTAAVLPTAYPMSMSCWFRTTNATAANRDSFFLGSTTTADQYCGFQIGADHKAVYTLHGSLSCWVTGGVALNDGAWHHLMGTSTDATTHSLYVDGKLVSATVLGDGSSGTFPALNVASMGRLNYGGLGIQYFPGDVDDIRVYTRGLSAAAALYAESLAGYPNALRRVRRAAWSVPAAPGGGVPLGTLALLGCGR